MLNLRHAELVAEADDSSDYPADAERGGAAHHGVVQAAEAVAGARQAILDQQLADEDALDQGFNGTPEPYARPFMF